MIHTTDGLRELYREGPYRQGAADVAMNRIVSDIRSKGLEPFLRERQIEQSQTGPIAVSSGRNGLFGTSFSYYRTLWVSKMGRKHRPG